ncbi:uncharacterized protein LOC118745566 [Rhagoletis pomonella]|uniref:uncharacterized protein LOC118745566 n=1 Tax=Rhagoletis pomonella TaxID=28610 RepID=UPI00177B7F21|nr:uncharacterized protein LOC118745566 [Rhagoletis pomonella]
MTSLQKFEFVREKLCRSRKESIAALHKFVFESEGERLNRQRLREFTGFQFDEYDDQYGQKLGYIENNLLTNDLEAICNVLGLNSNVADLKLHIFRNLQKATLLCAAVDNVENSDEEIECGMDDNSEKDDEDVMRSLKNYLRIIYINFECPHRTNARHFERERMGRRNTENPNVELGTTGVTKTTSVAQPIQMSRFSINFRDFEDSVRHFDGSENIAVEIWLNEFEETAILMGWDELQKFIFAKKSLRGLAKLFIPSERGITAWQKLKAALAEEFKMVVNTAKIHKQLSARNMKTEETVQEYFLCMKELALRGNIEENALMQYVIEGIRDSNINKIVLNLKGFKLRA